MNNGYYVGLDIGIASVGSAILDGEGNVIECTSNIFPEANAANNKMRRDMRQSRRLTRRRKTRINDFKELWNKYGFNTSTETDVDVVTLKVKALNNPITVGELYKVLLSELKHRGISYLEDDTDAKGNSDYAQSLNTNKAELKQKYPCEIQKERLEKYGFYRGNHIILCDGEKIYLSNVFTTGAYRKEVEQILKTQIENNTGISTDFVNEYMEIFNRKRKYYEGPGNEKSRTNYGKYKEDKDENGNYITKQNIFEELIGNCSVYSDEIRAAKGSFTAQEFNCLTDLNNITVNDRKLEENEKKEIIEAIIVAEGAVSMPKIIEKVLGEKVEIKGYRINRDEKPEYHTFSEYRSFAKKLENDGLSIIEFSRKQLDDISSILTISTDKEQAMDSFKLSNIGLTEEQMETLSNYTSLFSGWHSLSLKAMNEFIPEMYERNVNQMQIMSEGNYGVLDQKIFEGRKYIPVGIVDETIYNPVVKRSVRTSIKVINAYIKKYGYPEQIVIEMPRDRNSDEEKKRLKDIQKKYEHELDEIIKRVSKEYGFNITKEHFRGQKNLGMKLKLWNDQRGRCIYSGKNISVEDLVVNPNNYEIDHIIPRSISLDDSRSNKVLVYASENQEKGNRTPFGYFMSGAASRTWDEFEADVRVTFGDKEFRGKRRNLLFKEDITKLDVVKGFISRNLNDTRYASRVVLNTLQAFFKEVDSDTKIKVIRGAFTHQMRENLALDKNRDESYSHHAVDACLIALSQMGYDAYRKIQGEVIDFETGEILKDYSNSIMDDDTFKEYMYNNRIYDIRSNILKAEKECKYNYLVDKKVNRGLCNQTIRGSRDVEGETYKINFIRLSDNAGAKAFIKDINSGKEDKYLMKRNDPQTFEILKTIVKQYADATNPFAQYEKETGDYIRKYSQKGNGPRVDKLKYLDGEVGSCIDISDKYGYEKDAKKVFLENLVPYRADVFYDVNSNNYRIIGIKYSDMRAVKNGFVVDENKYVEILKMEGLLGDNQEYDNLKDNGYEFRFHLYKDDIVEYTLNGENYKERFLSRTMPKQKNYIETKPVDSAKFEKRHLIGLTKATNILKINTDILGNEYRILKEKF